MPHAGLLRSGPGEVEKGQAKQSELEGKIKEYEDKVKEYEAQLTDRDNQIDDLKAKLPPELPEPQMISDGTERRVCPKCGSSNYRLKEDKNKIISYDPILYAKQYVCSKCGQSWQ